jgi:hypothetical protein
MENSTGLMHKEAVGLMHTESLRPPAYGKLRGLMHKGRARTVPAPGPKAHLQV